MQISTSRRRFMRLIGGGSLAVALPLGIQGCDAGMPARAVEAWQPMPPPRDGDVRRYALAHALLAPNPHNRQPWIADLREPGKIALYCDEQRLLPETDPYYRQIVIGHGCFLELLLLALKAAGVSAELELFPRGEFESRPDNRPIALLRLGAAGSARLTEVEAELFAQVFRRRTNRAPYRMDQPLAPDTLSRMQAVAGSEVQCDGRFTAPDTAAIAGLARRAWDIEVTTPAKHGESVSLMRIGAAAIEAHRDGIALAGNKIWLAQIFGQLDAEALRDPTSQAFRSTLEFGREAAANSPGWSWLATAGNSRAKQIEAGRAYLRVALLASRLGLAMQPMSQVLQEYAEMAATQIDFYRRLGIDPKTTTVQMLWRLGYAEAPGPSPRRPLDAIIRA